MEVLPKKARELLEFARDALRGTPDAERPFKQESSLAMTIEEYLEQNPKPAEKGAEDIFA